MMRIAKIVQSIDNPFKMRELSQTPKGEKQRFRAELALDDTFSGKQELTARLEGNLHPAVSDARRQADAGRKDFSYPEYLTEWGSHGGSSPVVYPVFF